MGQIQKSLLTLSFKGYSENPLLKSSHFCRRCVSPRRPFGVAGFCRAACLVSSRRVMSFPIEHTIQCVGTRNISPLIEITQDSQALPLLPGRSLSPGARIEASEYNTPRQGNVRFKAKHKNIQIQDNPDSQNGR